MGFLETGRKFDRENPTTFSEKEFIEMALPMAPAVRGRSNARPAAGECRCDVVQRVIARRPLKPRIHHPAFLGCEASYSTATSQAIGAACDECAATWIPLFLYRYFSSVQTKKILIRPVYEPRHNFLGLFLSVPVTHRSSVVLSQKIPEDPNGARLVRKTCVPRH